MRITNRAGRGLRVSSSVGRCARKSRRNVRCRVQAVVVQHAKVGRTRVTESNNIKIKTLRKAEGSFEDKYLRIDLRKFHLLMRQKIEIHVLIIAGLSRLCRSRVFVLLAIYIPMKSIVPKPLWFVPIAALALLGAGCFSPAPEAPPTVAPTPVKPAPSAPTPSEPTPSEPAPSTPSGYELPEIDATWQTYTNNALGFSFPVPGSIRTGMGDEYRFESDAKMKDGCYFDEQTDAGTEKRVAIDGRNSVARMRWIPPPAADTTRISMRPSLVLHTRFYLHQARGEWRQL